MKNQVKINSKARCSLVASKLAFLSISALVSLGSVSKLSAQTEVERTQWFRDAKFGMFIHFGATERSVPQLPGMTRGERHEAAVRAFNPVDFDAGEWLKVAKDGGCKYIVFTTKHHDGFCKWDSALTEWDSIDQGEFKRDMVGELAEACKEMGLKLGCYYSVADWHHPEYHPYYSNRKDKEGNGFHYFPNEDANISKYMKFMYGQIEELCVKYEPSLFWFDGSSGFRPQERKRLLGQEDMMDLLHEHGAISNSRYGDDDGLRYVDYLTMGDNQAPPGSIGVGFEAAGTMNESWHYNPRDKDYKSVNELLRRLVTVVGKGGNYLLNVGPNDRGVIPESDVIRLKAMGDWLAKNGEAIYGTQAGPHQHGLSWGSITQRKVGKDTMLYLNVVDWPEDGIFELYGLNNDVMEASLLVSGEELEHSVKFHSQAGLKIHTIRVPGAAPDPNVSVIALKIRGDASMDQAYLQQNDGRVLLDSYKATIHERDFISDKPQRAVDFKTYTVPLKAEGIRPARMLTVEGLNMRGQALSWDFRMVEPGRFKVAVITMKEAPDYLLQVNVAGQSVKGAIENSEKIKTIELPSHLKEHVTDLGVIDIKNTGMQTLTLEVADDYEGSAPRIRGVSLIPIPGS